jgi:hypothetical protein
MRKSRPLKTLEDTEQGGTMRITNFMRNHIARNIAANHASKHMRKAGRKRWNDEDRAVAIAKYNERVTPDERADLERRLTEARTKGT